MDFFNTIYLRKKNLINNINVIKKNAKGKKICAMVKANAYNHNLKFIVLNIKRYVDFFGVANSEEALEVRKLTQKNKILLCGDFNYEKLDKLIQNNVSLTIYSLKQINQILRICKKNNLKVNLHLKINTGMNRLGIINLSYLKKMINKICDNEKFLNLEGIFSHFLNCENENICNKQYEKFIKFVQTTKQILMNNYSQNNENLLIHIQNSGGIFFKRDINNICNMCRVGIALYGVENFNKNLKPVLSLKSKIIAIQFVKCNDYIGYGNTLMKKNGKVAIIPIGYADGILKRYTDCFVYIKNIPCKILNICMDMILVDLTNVNAKIGDEAEIISNTKKQLNSADNLALQQNTISYEILTALKYNRVNCIFN